MTRPRKNKRHTQPGRQLSLLPQEDLVVKSNRFITAKYDWSPLEHRIIAMMIAQLKKDDESFAVQRVWIRDVRELSNTESKDLYHRGEEICQKLLSQKIEVKSINENGKRQYEGYNLLSTCKYVEGSGHILAKFNDDMRPFLLELKRRFTMYQLQYVMQLRSQYSIRLYENLKMREDLRFYRLNIPDLRELLSIEHKYTGSFSQVKAKVLEPAREEIKEKADIYFTYHVERDGRTPVAINFMIHANEDVEPVMSPDEIRRFENGLWEGQPSEVLESTSSKVSAASLRDEDGSRSKRESRPPRMDGYELFLKDRTQEELTSVSDTKLQELRERATAMAEEQHPGASASYLAGTVHRIMERLWKEHGSESEL